MGLGSLYAEIQSYRDVFAGFAFCEELNYFALPRGKPVFDWSWLVDALVEVSVQDHLGYAGSEEGRAALQGLNRRHQIARRVRFQEETARANFQNLAYDLFGF